MFSFRTTTIPAQVLSRISRRSTLEEHGRFLWAVLPKKTITYRTQKKFPRARCQACLGHIHAERVGFLTNQKDAHWFVTF